MNKFIVITSVILGAGLFLRASSSAPAASPAKHPDLDQSMVQQAVGILDQVEKENGLSVAELTQIAKQAIELLGDQHYATDMLREALVTGTSKVVLNAEILKVHESLTFRPLMEAKVPNGFPRFTPLHHIEVKKYPQYRLARVQMNEKIGRSGNGAFFSLFNHIKRNNIAMTAPVQVEYSETENTPKEVSMAFLYGNTEIGALGNDAANTNVKVIDIPEQLVISIGVRGGMTEGAVEQARQKLKKWLSNNINEYAISGPHRKMGYNSPFVSREKKYYEVQIPVTKITN